MNVYALVLVCAVLVFAVETNDLNPRLPFINRSPSLRLLCRLCPTGRWPGPLSRLLTARLRGPRATAPLRVRVPVLPLLQLLRSLFLPPLVLFLLLPFLYFLSLLKGVLDSAPSLFYFALVPPPQTILPSLYPQSPHLRANIYLILFLVPTFPLLLLPLKSTFG